MLFNILENNKMILDLRLITLKEFLLMSGMRLWNLEVSTIESIMYIIQDHSSRKTFSLSLTNYLLRMSFKKNWECIYFAKIEQP
jgi:hypothetical protein